MWAIDAARAAAATQRFVLAGALYRALVARKPRDTFPGGTRAWLGIVLQSLRQLRTMTGLANTNLEEANRTAISLGDVGAQGVLNGALAAAALRDDNPERARRLLAAARDAAHASSGAVRAEIHMYLAIGQVLLGFPRAAVGLFEELLGDVPEDVAALIEPSSSAPATGLFVIAGAYGRAGQVPRALELIHRIRAFGRERDLPALEREADLFASLAHGELLDFEAARAHAERAFEYYAATRSDPFHLWFAAQSLACVRGWEGRTDELPAILEAGLGARHASGLAVARRSRGARAPRGARLPGHPDRGVRARVRARARAAGGNVSGRGLGRALSGAPARAGARRRAGPRRVRGLLDESIALLREAGAEYELARALDDAAALARGGGAAGGRSPAPGAAPRRRRAGAAPARRAGAARPARVTADPDRARAARLARGARRRHLGRDRGAALPRARRGALRPRRGGRPARPARGARRHRRRGATRSSRCCATGRPPRSRRSPPRRRRRSRPPGRSSSSRSPPRGAPAGRASRTGTARPRSAPPTTRSSSVLSAQLGILLGNVALWQELERARERLEAENRYWRSTAPALSPGSRIVGDSPALRQVLELVARVAPGTTPVLVTGETGVGKELVASEVHRQSPRRSGPFIAVNVASFSPGLVASGLFGHERGAFTGATEQAKGRFELADGGTLFLDEIGELAAEDQVQLLRVLQERRRSSGSAATRPIRSDFRLVAATNRDLAGGGPGGALPRGPLLPARRIPAPRPAAARAARGIPTLALYFMERREPRARRPLRGHRRGGRAAHARVPVAGQRPRARARHRASRRPLRAAAAQDSGARRPDPPARARRPDGAAAAERGTRGGVITLAEAERRHIAHVLRHVRGRITGEGGRGGDPGDEAVDAELPDPEARARRRGEARPRRAVTRA